jgi:hypothetical protein
MSASLISKLDVQHTFKDDLESSIYVLLWLVLTHSKVSLPDQVPGFLVGVLDPQPYASVGGFGKADFLKGRSFLNVVTFPERPALHKLIDELAQLFAVRYEPKPPDPAVRVPEGAAKDNPLFMDMYQTMYKELPSFLHSKRLRDLESHAYTISLFNDALSDISKWPTNDAPVKQLFFPTPRAPMIKTGWNATTLTMEGPKIKFDSSDVMML